ncbi:MAG: NEW3 domain-containing protein [Candidatus Parvarchaeota archaeon]|nr:NEW3 domain-containing protein [Candidatus Jingweiarchaeum tengchongense]MCW1299692.1 NEW3 domain-containing protein [Candidatus Jingweiarchaeum tengchongense]MCW1305677.1 NEW3 domain-containing protein [Candidatus Jingweiarchaeum tengchongense]MCW1311181.1 NEW3 domain-containing protein [Candidatus Jingweiarchaeum tengchongense]
MLRSWKRLVILAIWCLFLISFSKAEWWNTSFHYRVPVNISTGNYNRTEWPIEIRINFTQLIYDLKGRYEIFDNNSIRVIEYDSDGYVINDNNGLGIVSQFDEDEDYDATYNAVGELVFLLNGTTPANTTRYFYIYFDTMENQKQPPSYQTNLTYVWDDEEFNVNNSIYRLWIDTLRNDNTSGIYKVNFTDGRLLTEIAPSGRTLEYVSYWNSTNQFMYNLSHQMKILYAGPVRIVVEQLGNESLWNSNVQTNQTKLRKKYVFYEKNQWIRINETLSNVHTTDIDRCSNDPTYIPGAPGTSDYIYALAIDARRGNFYGNAYVINDWVSVFNSSTAVGMGVILLYNSTPNYFVDYSDTWGRIGVQLDNTTIPINESISFSAILYFNNISSHSPIEELRNRVFAPVSISMGNASAWYINITTITNHDVYNRKEMVSIIANVTSDPWNLVNYVNATLDLNSLLMQLTYAGFKYYTGNYTFANNDTTGVWNITTIAYDSSWQFLNQSSKLINLTDIYNMNLTIRNKYGPISRKLITDVGIKNYRNDTNIVGIPQSNFSCNLTILEFSEIGNGLYNLNFTAPIEIGNYTLFCNINFNGNVGNSTDSYITEENKTQVSIELLPDNITATNITSTNSQIFEMNLTAINLRNGTAYKANITISLPTNWSATQTFFNCGDIAPSNNCTIYFNVTIPSKTHSGNYVVNATIAWMNPDGSINQTSDFSNVNVTSNITLYIPENELIAVVEHGRNMQIGNFTLNSLGNDPVSNISFSYQIAENISIIFTPSDISYLDSGESIVVFVNVSVPAGYAPGNYIGNITIDTENDGSKTLLLNIDVPLNRTWTRIPSACYKYIAAPVGFACNITINNTGNAELNFTIHPNATSDSMVNQTWPNVTSIFLEKQTSYVLPIFYNITGLNNGTFQTTYTITANQSDAIPQNLTTIVNITISLGPEINITIYPSLTEQMSDIVINASLYDRSYTGISWVKINVTRPNGTIDTTEMILVNSSGDFSNWTITYPHNWGSTLLRGRYDVIVYSMDNTGAINNVTGNFTIHANLSIIMRTGASSYFQGENGIIRYNVYDSNQIPLQNVSVWINITDPEGNRLQIIPSSPYITNSNGTLDYLPQFEITSDAKPGNYTLSSYSSFFDPITNTSTNKMNSTIFFVYPVLSADFITVINWFPNNLMRFIISTYERGIPADPEQMNLVVYDPNLVVYINASSLNNFTRRSVGSYIFAYMMPSSPPLGQYTAFLNVSKDGFRIEKTIVFNVVQGPQLILYDIILMLLKSEVNQSENLPFELTIINKGNVNQDVYVDYWISTSPLGIPCSNCWVAKNADVVFVPVNSSVTLSRSAPIYSTQAPGTYYLNTNVTYGINFTDSKTIQQSKSFIVRGAQPTNVTPITNITPLLIIPNPRISIIGYPSVIDIEKGWTKYVSVEIKNVGNTNLNNISLQIAGIPFSWFEITPSLIGILYPENSTTFLIKISPPSDTETAEFNVTLIVTSDLASDSKRFVLGVFSTLQEMLKRQISRLWEQYNLVRGKAGVASSEGKNVTAVLDLLNQAKMALENAENYLNMKMYDECIASIGRARDLIDKAEQALLIAPVIRVIPEKPVEVLPNWIPYIFSFLSLLILIIVLTMIIFYLLKRKREEEIRPSIEEIKRVKEVIEREPKDILERKRDAIKEALKVIEREHRMGLLSTESYGELKRKNEEKLAIIERKLKGEY